MQNIQRISKMVGVTFEGLEDKLMEIFIEIEKMRAEKRKVVSIVGKERKRAGEGGTKELKRLQSSINYDYNRKCSRNKGNCQGK